MLTYDIIVKYLMPVVNNFSLQPNIILKSVDFTMFNKIFDDTFYRIGVNNSTFKSCLLYCIDENLYNTESDQINNIITTNTITESVNKLNINIIIFDFKNNKITSEYYGNYFNPWRPTILLANYDDYYEPIITKECKIFSFSSYKSNILKTNILMQNIYKNNTNNCIIINDNFKEIIELENFIKVSENNTSEEEEIYTHSKLDKMKKDDLILLCNKLNKQITTSKPTKKNLIELILN
jgi:hypothetical protein